MFFLLFIPMNSQLRDYAERLSGFSGREPSCSAAGLYAMCRACVALFNLSVTVGDEASCGTREALSARISHLSAVCLERFRREKNFAARCRLLNAWQVLTHEPFSPCLPCDGDSGDLLGDFIARELPLHRDCGQPDWLWCVARWAYPPDACSTGSDAFRCFRMQLAAWVAQLDGKDHWPGLTDGETLARLDLLNAHAEMFLDNAYGEAIRSVYAYCRRHVEVRATTDPQRLLAMGRLAEQAGYFCAYPYDAPVREAVFQAMADSVHLLPAGSEELLYVLSFLVCGLCETVASTQDAAAPW